jgi:hypothetical protein
MEEYRYVGVMLYCDFCAKYTNVGVLYTSGMSVSNDTQVEVYETSCNVAIDVSNFRVAEYVKL